ncbi:MAG: ATP-binding protein [Gemmatimonadales bacterium]
MDRPRRFWNLEPTELPDREQLKRALSLLEAALESTADGLLVVDLEGRVLGFNQTFLTLWRIPDYLVRQGADQALLGFVLDQLANPEAFVAQVNQIYANRDAVTFDVLEFKDGRIFERYSQPQRIDGAAVGRVWSFRDVTDRRRTERMLRESGDWFRKIIDQVPHFIFAKDADGRYVLVNRALAMAYGTTVDGLLGKRDADFVSVPGEAAAYAATDRLVLDTGGSVQVVEDRLTDASGAVRQLESTKVPIDLLGTGRPGVLGVSIDVTARRLLEAELRQSQKMDAVGRLAGGIAHDFNNLLTAILGFSSSIFATLDEDDPRRRDLEDVIGAARRAADLTRQLLTFSRRQVLQARVLDVNLVVQGLGRLLTRILGDDVQIALRLDDALPAVRADQGQLEQVLLNLAVNAREAMPDGGHLVIETHATVRPPGYAGPSPEGGWILLKVSDTGVGMTADEVSRVFEPFYTTKEQGTGLGLAVVYGIVEQAGGRIAVDSVPGRGTTFDVYLPATGEAPAPAAAGPGRLPPGATATVLLAEDEDSVRRLTRMLLEQDGLVVLEAASGEDALALAEQWTGAIDVLLTDLVMPGMNGRELAGQILAARPDTKVVFMSGYTADSLGRDSAPFPGIPFLQKPFEGNELRRVVREAVQAAKAAGGRATGGS